MHVESGQRQSASPQVSVHVTASQKGAAGIAPGVRPVDRKKRSKKYRFLLSQEIADTNFLETKIYSYFTHQNTSWQTHNLRYLHIETQEHCVVHEVFQ